MTLATEQSTATTKLLLLLGLSAAVGLVYASIVPLQFTQVSWDTAVQRFREIPWLNLDVYRRADWVANGIVAIPFGFLLAGAADKKRRLTVGYVLLLAAVMLFGLALIVGIEFLQIWFPPRTVSQNDILAGAIGAVLGPLLWPIFGRPLLQFWEKVRDTSWNRLTSPRIASWLLACYCVLVSLYSIMPLDVILSVTEWDDKWKAGRFRLLAVGSPKASGSEYAFQLITNFGLSAARMIPLGVLVHMAQWRRAGIFVLVGFPIFVELIQAPIFTRYTVASDVLCGWTGGLVGFLLAMHSGTILSWNRIPAVRLGLLVAAWIATLVAFVGRFERVRTQAEIEEAWGAFWTAPFAKYYYTSEFSAGSNFAGKLIVFAMLGFVLANFLSWRGRSAITPSALSKILALTFVCLFAAAIELLQVFLYPLIADASDIAIYGIGAAIGWFLYRTISCWDRSSNVSRTSLGSTLFRQ